MHSLPRSLPRTSSSSVPHPLLIGFLIGVFGTLFVQGFMFILYRVCRRHRMGKRARPFGSSEARHIEQFTMSASTTSLNGTASLLRVAHRNPDGSWSFTNSNDQSTSQTASTPALSPSQSSASPPWSPDASTSTTTASPSYSRPLPTPPWSPDTLALSSSSNSNSRAPPSAFPPELAQSSSQMDVVDCGSSARTGPPPYNTMPLPVPSIPREYRTAKEHHRR